MAIIMINTLVFIYFVQKPIYAINKLYRLLGFTPAVFFSMPAGLAWSYRLTLLTSMFIHGSLGHVLTNMLYLWVFGSTLEDEIGHLPFLAFYLCSGMLATLCYGISRTGSWLPLIGASGAAMKIGRAHV